MKRYRKHYHTLLHRNCIFLVLPLFFIFLFSCKHKEIQISERTDFKEVMKWHDEAMVEMGRIYDLKKKINGLLPSLDSAEIKVGKDLVLLLENADEGMMDWMAEFKTPDESSEKEKKAFFADELNKVIKVHTDIFNSIEKAEEFINEHNNEN